MQFVSTAAVKQYDDLKYSGNYHDAFHLSCDLASYQQDTFTPKHSERSGIYCGALSLVKSGSAQLISVQSQIWHSSGIRVKSNKLRKPDFKLSLLGGYTLQAAKTRLTAYAAFHKEINVLEQSANHAVKLTKNFEILQTIKGIGKIMWSTEVLRACMSYKMPA